MGPCEEEGTGLGTSLAHFRNSKKAGVAAAEGVARGDPEVDRGPITQRKQVCIRDLVFVWRAAFLHGKVLQTS